VPDQQAASGRGTQGTQREDGDAARPDEVEALRARIAELEEQVKQLEDNWRRALADLDNLRKRMAREIQAARAEERARVVAQWLPVVDHLELALEHARAVPGALIEGVRVVRDQAVGVIERLGFKRVDEVGVPFDPARHEAVGTVRDPDVVPGTVVKVVRPGYGDGESQLRPAGVIVATGDQ
jgi:molecular chaperone GrpE